MNIQIYDSAKKELNKLICNNEDKKYIRIFTKCIK